MVFYKFIASTMIVSSFFVVKDSCYAGGNKKTDEFTEHQTLKRQSSFRDSLRLFQKADPQKKTLKPRDTAVPLTSNNSLRITSNNAVPITSGNTDFDNWSDLDEGSEENDPRFSLGAQSRLKHTKKRMEKGENPEDIQKTSKFWYEKNSTRCTTAKQLRLKGKTKEAQNLLEDAHQEGFPAATFALTQQFFNDGNLYKARLFLRETCTNLQRTYHLYDDQYLEILVEGIRTFVKGNTSLEAVWGDFKEYPLFQEKIKEKPKYTPSAALLGYDETDADDEEFSDSTKKLDMSLLERFVNFTFKGK